MAVKVITPPTAEPITLAEVKANLRVVLADDDADITRMIVAARQTAEGILNRTLMRQTLEMAVDYFPWPYTNEPSNPYGVIRLLAPPLGEVVSVKYVDPAGAQQTLDPSTYVVNDFPEPAEIAPAYGKAWPTTQLRRAAVVIRYTAGYATAADVPASIKQWMHMAVGTMYATRESNSDVQLYSLPDGFMHDLIQPYEVYE